jgi:hypothetical protein
VPEAVALAVSGILSALALVHVYWAFGGKIGGTAVIPQADGRAAFSPSRLATLMVAGCLFAAAYVVAVAGHLIASPLHSRLAAFGLSTVFLARAVGDFRLVGFFKRLRKSRFARLDTTLYSPLCLSLGLAIGYVAYHDV